MARRSTCSAKSTRGPPNRSATSWSITERGSSVLYTRWPNPMMRPPAATFPRSHSSVRSGVPMSSIMSSALEGAPPCSGPDSAPIAPSTAEARSAPVEAITLAVNVEALNP